MGNVGPREKQRGERGERERREGKGQRRKWGRVGDGRTLLLALPS